MTRSCRSSVVALSADSEREELLDALSVDPHDFDVVFVDSIARGSARIRELRPDIIVVFMTVDDVAACRLLSMLTVDRSVSGIPVVTCVRPRSRRTVEPIYSEMRATSSKDLWT